MKLLFDWTGAAPGPRYRYRNDDLRPGVQIFSGERKEKKEEEKTEKERK